MSMTTMGMTMTNQVKSKTRMALAPARPHARALTLGLVAYLALGVAAAPPAVAADQGDDPTDVERLTTENEELRRRIEELEAREGAAARSGDESDAGGTVAVPAAPPAGGGPGAPRLTTITEAGTRTVSTGASRLEVTRGSRAPQWVAFRYQRTGEQPVRAVTMDLHTQFSGHTYRSAKTLELSVDGNRVDCPVTSYDSRAVTGGGSRRRVSRDHEVLTVSIPVATLRQLAAARAVTGSLGPVAFALTNDQLASLRALDGSVGN
jgi:hypothetical protein